MAPGTRRRAADGAVEQYDPATRFLYVPHTVTFLFLGADRLILPASLRHAFQARAGTVDGSGTISTSCRAAGARVLQPPPAPGAPPR